MPTFAYVDDIVDVYRRWSKQAMLKPLHLEEGTQRLLEPVSKTTVNSCGGVPSPISP